MKVLQALLALVLVAPVALAQDSSEPAPGPSQEAQDLIAALEAAAGQELSGQATVSEELPKSAMNFPGAMVIGGLSGEGNPLYTGDLEVHVHDGAVSAAATAQLPHVTLYRKGNAQLIRQTYSGDAKDVGQTARALAKCLDFTALCAEVKSAPRVRVKDVDAGKEYRLTIGEEYFEPDVEEGLSSMEQQMMAMMAGPSVLEGILVVTVNGAGSVNAMSLTVQYNDPMADLLGKAMDGDGAAFDPTDFGKSETPGRKVIVQFDVSSEVSQAAKDFAAEARGLLLK